MGVVYEAEQISLRRRVALKVLPFAAATDAGNGTNVVNAPAPAVFAGTDGVFGVGDRWLLTSAAVDFVARGVAVGNVCLLTKPTSAFRVPGDLLGRPASGKAAQQMRLAIPSARSRQQHQRLTARTAHADLPFVDRGRQLTQDVRIQTWNRAILIHAERPGADIVREGVQPLRRGERGSWQKGSRGGHF